MEYMVYDLFYSQSLMEEFKEYIDKPNNVSNIKICFIFVPVPICYVLCSNYSYIFYCGQSKEKLCGLHTHFSEKKFTVVQS